MWFFEVLKLSGANYTWTILNNIKAYQLTKKKVPLRLLHPYLLLFSPTEIALYTVIKAYFPFLSCYCLVQKYLHNLSDNIQTCI